jgi:hypothetical protein
MCAVRGFGVFVFVDFVARMDRLRVTLAKRRLYNASRIGQKKSPGCFHPGLIFWTCVRMFF